MSDFKIIKPIFLNEDVQTSSNLSNTTPDWNSGTTYTVGTEVVYGSESGDPIPTVYSSLTNGNLNNTPYGDTTNWEELYTCNEWAYRDQKAGDYSYREHGMTLEFTPEQTVTGVALFGLVTQSLNINMVADTRTNKLTNGYFTTDLYGWTDDSLILSPTWVTGGYLELERGAVNYAKIIQTVSGTSGKKRIIKASNNSSSTASMYVAVNGVVLLTLAAGNDGEEVFISDGSDNVAVYAGGVGFIWAEYVELKEISDDNLLSNGGFEADITDWNDNSSGTGSSAWDARQYLALTSGVGPSDYGGSKQTVAGTSGDKRKVVVKNGSASTGNLDVIVNATTVLTISAGDEDEAIFVSDGSDVISLKASSTSSVAYVDYAILTEYTQYDETINALDVSTVIKTDLPDHSNGILTITLTKFGAINKIGELAIGEVETLGTCEWGSSIGLLDYSTKDRDEDTGVATLEEGNFSKTVDYRVVVRTFSANSLFEVLAEYRATPVVWIGSADLLELIIYGFLAGFNIVESSATKKECSIQIEELS